MFAMGRGFAVPEEGTMLAEKVVVMVIKNAGGGGGGGVLEGGEKGVTCPLITI